MAWAFIGLPRRLRARERGGFLRVLTSIRGFDPKPIE
jgi:hypothetical protein